MSFAPISTQDNHAGLVWSQQVTPQYLAELQTGVLPQLIHLVIFDVEDNNTVVYEQVQAYEIGESLTEENLEALEVAVASAMETL